MERLIEKVETSSGTYYKSAKATQTFFLNPGDQEAFNEIFKMLYEYQDTSLTPEEIQGMKSLCEKTYDNLRHQLNEYRHTCDGRSPEDIKRALELLDAEKQGYLIKLPCKVRDLLYEPKTNCTEQITDIEVVFKAGGREFKHSDIGETVFLTREAALKGRDNHGR